MVSLESRVLDPKLIRLFIVKNVVLAPALVYLFILWRLVCIVFLKGVAVRIKLNFLRNNM